jgi:hypothetical protein
MGLAYSPLSLTVLRDAPAESQGAATAGLQLSDVVGTALGTGVGGALIAIGHREGLADWVGLGATFTMGAAVALLGVVVAGRMSVGKFASAATSPKAVEADREARSPGATADASASGIADPTR